MDKKITILILCLIFSDYSNTFAVQFQDYGWGKAIGEVKEMLKNKQKGFLTSGGERVITYNDKILDEPCKVSLIFTPSSKLLAAVQILWEEVYVGNKLKALLINKYGQPFQQTKFIDEYLWNLPTKGEVLTLDYTFNGAKLSYYGGGYYRRYEREEKELASAETEKF